MNVIISSKLMPGRIRKCFYMISRIQDKSVNISAGAYFRTNKVKFGNGTYVNNNCYFDNLEIVEIGDKCHIAMEVLFCTVSHEIGSDKQRGGKVISAPIKIGNGCWIGARTTILPGVTIRDGCIIAAGSVVNKDCEPNGLYAGIPAQRIKDLLVS